MARGNQRTEFQIVCILIGEINFDVAKSYFRSCKYTRRRE